MEQYLFHLVFIASLSTTAVLTPPILRLARRQEIVDRPGLHKTHLEPKPLLGGLAIFIGFVLTIFIFLELSPKMTSLMSGALVLVLLGLYDDLFHLRPLYKLGGQVLAASVAVIFNISYFYLFIEALGRYGIPAFVTLFLIIGWIVLIINAFNLIDGLDGLASGTAAIIFLALALITLITGGSTNMLALQLAGAGACFGFLFYNFNPARIFMGDTGSMLIGYLLAITYLFSINSSFNLNLVLGSMFVFAYPAMDTGFAILRRLRNGTSIFQADKRHVHHILRNLGFSVCKTVILIYIFNICFAAMAVFLFWASLPSITLILIGLTTIVFVYVLLSYFTALSKQEEIS